MLKALMEGKIAAVQMRDAVERSKKYDRIAPLIETIRAGEAVAIEAEQVLHYNSLQALQADRFVIDPDGKFEVARSIAADRRTAEENKMFRCRSGSERRKDQ